MFISIHIPKTAGTVLANVFDYGSGRTVLFDYKDDYSNALTCNPLWVENIDFIKKAFWGIHGHFYYKKYSSLIPDAHYITCIRHPVIRLESQFKHELYEALHGAQTWRSKLLASGEMSIVDFVCSDPNTRIAQVIHLEGRDIAKYDHIFLTENLQRSLATFRAKFGFKRNDPWLPGPVPQINEGSVKRFEDPALKARFDELTADLDKRRVDIFNLVSEEVELYRRGVEAFEKESARLS